MEMDNYFPNCPAKMSYGGPWTDYRPHCVINNIMTSESTPMSSEEYRRNMIANGEKMMLDSRKTVEQMYACSECKAPKIPSEASKQTCWNNICTYTSIPFGLGLGKN